MKLTFVSDEVINRLDKKNFAGGKNEDNFLSGKVFRDCDGSFMFDSEDIPYLDLQAGYADCNFGYKNPQILQAVVRQLHNLPQLSPQFLYDYKSMLAEKLVDANEKRFGKSGFVHFTSHQIQAFHDAVKLALSSEESGEFFRFSNGCQADNSKGTWESFNLSDSLLNFRGKVHSVPFPYCFRCPCGKKTEDCNFYCVKNFLEKLENEYSSPEGREKAKIFIASTAAVDGCINPPQGYFSMLKNILDKFGFIFVADETKNGLYRMGKLWAVENYGIIPDIIIFSDLITNGLHYLSGFWAKHKFQESYIFHSNFASYRDISHPIAIRAAYEVMSVADQENFENTINAKSERFLSGLHYLKNKYSKFIGDVGGLGLALRIEITYEDKITPNKFLCRKILEEGLSGKLLYNGKKCGLILNNTGYYQNIIPIVPSLFISDDEIDMAIELFNQIFAKVSADIG